jgi:hypothetical protein
MRIGYSGLAVVLCASCALGQTQATDRVYNLSHTATAKDFQALTKLIVSVAKVNETSANEAQRTLSVTGTTNQIAVSDWLVKELDRDAPTNPAAQPSQDKAVHQYAASDNDMVRIFYFPLVGSIAGFQNIATVVRTIVYIANAYAYNPLRAIVVRDTSDQIATAAWMVEQMTEAIQTGLMSADEYRMPRVTDNVIRMYLAKSSDSIQTVAEIVTDIRSIGDIRRIFTAWAPDLAPEIVAMRGTNDQIALGDWLFQQLEQASPVDQNTASIEYRMSEGAPENVVRIFYLPRSLTVQKFQNVAQNLRTQTGVRRLFTYNAPRALIVRGTPDQMNRVAELLQASAVLASQ